jgi:hypothetical protein
MSIQKIAGYVMISLGFYFAVVTVMGVIDLAKAPPAPSVGTWVAGAILVIVIPGLASWGLIKYGRKWSA